MHGGLGSGVYPRVCGGTHVQILVWAVLRGLSPRVRGNLGWAAMSREPSGSIPACAGEPARQCGKTPLLTVYPRVCGGTRFVHTEDEAEEGLSPRVRGNRAGRGTTVHRNRSIPACAGEPGRLNFHIAPDGVYPRVCGGTLPAPILGEVAQGLSPRVRGNLQMRRPRLRSQRSIPACAGEPGKRRACASASPVYPRVCGGTGERKRHGA